MSEVDCSLHNKFWFCVGDSEADLYQQSGVNPPTIRSMISVLEIRIGIVYCANLETEIDDASELASYDEDIYQLMVTFSKLINWFDGVVGYHVSLTIC